MAKRSGAAMIDLEPPMPVVPEIQEPSNDNSDDEIPVIWEGVEQEENSGVHEKPLIMRTMPTREGLVMERSAKAAKYEELHGVLKQGNGTMRELLQVLRELDRSMGLVGRAYMKVALQGIEILNQRWIKRLMGPLVLVCGLMTTNDALDQAADGRLRSGEAMKMLTDIYGPKKADGLMKEIEQAGHQYGAIKKVMAIIGEEIADEVEEESKKNQIVGKVTRAYDEAYSKSMKGKK